MSKKVIFGIVILFFIILEKTIAHHTKIIAIIITKTILRGLHLSKIPKKSPRLKKKIAKFLIAPLKAIRRVITKLPTHFFHP